MAGALDADGAEVHCQHVEGGFGAALDGGCHQGREAIHAVSLHGFDQHRPCRTAGKRFDQGCGQAFDKAGIPAQPLDRMTDAIQSQLQSP
ncbi:hypothetical protein D9M71_714210 [compost metagenome]